MTISQEEIEDLLTLFSTKGQYDAGTGAESELVEIQKRCNELFEKDYNCYSVENENGFLSPNYPSTLIIPFEEKQICPESEVSRSSESHTSTFNAAKYREIANKCHRARCRTRFPVPVIFYEGKFVCRSSTLACIPEVVYRDLSTAIFNTSANNNIEEKYSSGKGSGIFGNEYRSHDINLLKELSVSYICDLMVENKKVKYGLTVSSSEKVDKENRYCDFKIVQLPYPGCEFFKNYKDNNYIAEGLLFDWEQNYVDSSLRLPSDSATSSLGINWCNYKVWDLVKLSQNYLKLLLTYIIEGTSSILIHCISGWDRTPLFISLLRMSLWADGRAHASLSAVEIAYLTLAYDWYLFGHDLPSRLRSGEEIMFFCFEFLKFLVSDEFSIKKRCRKISNNCADNALDILVEEECPMKSVQSSESCSSLHNSENERTSIFYASLDGSQDNCSPKSYYSSLSSDESDNLKTKNSVLIDTSSSGSDSPPSVISNLENLANNNGIKCSVSSSSPVPVPNTRQRMDSLSSLGSWQFVSGTGSLLGSVTSRSSVEVPLNSSHSNCSLSHENSNGNSASAASSNSERAERLKSVRTLVTSSYTKIIGSQDWSYSEISSYFSWLKKEK